MFLEEIIDTSQKEDNGLECKGRLDRSNVIDWLKTFAGFANANGGMIYEEIISMSIHSQTASFDTLLSDQEYHTIEVEVGG